MDTNGQVSDAPGAETPAGMSRLLGVLVANPTD